MAPHYAGGTPEEACQTETIELSFDSLYIPGRGEEFSIETVLEVDDVMHEGELLDGEKVAARSTPSPASWKNMKTAEKRSVYS